MLLPALAVKRTYILKGFHHTIEVGVRKSLFKNKMWKMWKMVGDKRFELLTSSM